MYLIKAFILVPYVAVVALNVLMLVYAPDRMRAELGAPTGVLVPVLVACAFHWVRMVKSIDHEHQQAIPFCVGTPAQLYGEDHDDGRGGSPSHVHVGRRHMDRHVHSERPAATPAVR